LSSSIRLRALLDTNVFIYAFEIPKSNSNLILKALNQDQFEAIVTESTFREVYRYLRKHYSKKLADEYRVYLFTVCKIVFSHQLQPHLVKYIDEINDRDIEQLTAVREFGIKYLVSYDKHFADIEEYKTPKQFAKILRLGTHLTDY